jgi:hypothetical protein
MKFFAAFTAIAAFGLVLSTQAIPQTQQPPEYKEVLAASRLQDLAAKIKELDRIKSAYPNTQYVSTIESWILEAKIDLAASERAADEYLTDFEKTSTRFQNFKFPERHAKIDRAKLGVVFFVQNKETKKVLNAVYADGNIP